MYFFELVTVEPICNYSCYYYFATGRHNAPRSLEMTNKYPDELRLLIEDREETPIILECIDFFTYIYRKFIKNKHSYLFGYRVNWEKEEL